MAALTQHLLSVTLSHDTDTVALRSHAPPPHPHCAALHVRHAAARRIRASPRRCRNARAVVAAFPSPTFVPGEAAALAALAAIAAASWHLERRTAFGRQVSAPLLSMGLAAVAISFMPPCVAMTAAVARVWDVVVPFALALQLLGADLRQLARSRDAVAAFGCAALGTVIGTAFAFAACARWVGPHAWQLAACLCASYIGGSVNFAATASALGMGTTTSGGALIAAAMALDNLMMALFLALLLAWPAANVAAPPPAPNDACGAVALTLPTAPAHDAPASSHAATALRWAVAGCVAAACCAAAAAAASALRFPGSFLAMVAVFAAAASAAASWLSRRPTAALLGADTDAASAALLLLFFGALGASAGPSAAASVGPAAAAFIAVQLSTHLAVTLAAGAALRLPRQLLLLASNAAVGGPATAAAMAAARGWPHLAPVAVLLGTLGYVVGTAAGVAAAAALRFWQSAGTMLL